MRNQTMRKVFEQTYGGARFPSRNCRMCGTKIAFTINFCSKCMPHCYNCGDQSDEGTRLPCDHWVCSSCHADLSGWCSGCNGSLENCPLEY